MPNTKTLTAIQYTADNVELIVKSFNIDPLFVDISYSDKSIKLRKNGHRRIAVGEWLVLKDGAKPDGPLSYDVLSDEIVQNILTACK